MLLFHLAPTFSRPTQRKLGLWNAPAYAAAAYLFVHHSTAYCSLLMISVLKNTHPNGKFVPRNASARKSIRASNHALAIDRWLSGPAWQPENYTLGCVAFAATCPTSTRTASRPGCRNKGLTFPSFLSLVLYPVLPSFELLNSALLLEPKKRIPYHIELFFLGPVIKKPLFREFFIYLLRCTPFLPLRVICHA